MAVKEEHQSGQSTPSADGSVDTELLATARLLDGESDAGGNENVKQEDSNGVKDEGANGVEMEESNGVKHEQSNGVKHEDQGDTKVGANGSGTGGRGRKVMTEEEKQEAQRRRQQQAEEEEDSEEHQKRAAKLKFLLQRSGVYSKIMAEKMEKERQARADAEAKKAQEGQKEDANGSSSKQNNKPAAAGRSTRAGEAGDKAAQAPSDDSGRGKRGQQTATKRKAKDGEAAVSDYITSEDLKASNGSRSGSPAAKKHKGNDGDASSPSSGQSRQPALVTGAEMRDYQLDGCEWLVGLYENGLNGILADEMGLGKTLQTIAFLAHLRGKGVWGPFLIVAPLSTIGNWVNEFERFTPGIPAMMYHAQDKHKRAALRKQIRYPTNPEEKRAFPVVVTSFEIAMMDRAHLSHLKWKYIVVDEGHRLKNMNCRLIQELKRFSSAQRLILTGTPLHNNLKELWSLLNFILPEIFDDLETFEKWFDFSDIHEEGGSNRLLSREDSKSIITQLHAILKPFLLRRLKTDVEQQLPPKKEYLLYAPLSPLQKELYERCVHGNVRRWLLERKTGLPWAEIQSVLGGGSTSAQDEMFAEDQDAKGGRGRKSATASAATSRAGSADPRETGPSKSRSKRRGAQKNVSYEEESDDAFLDRIENGEGHQEVQPPTASEQEHEGKLYAIRQAQRQINNMKLQNLFMQLRKICCHPYLFDWPREPDGRQLIDKTLITSSGKMLMLNRLLDSLFARQHKVLIFSQFTTILDIIEDWAEEYKKIRTCRIDGTTSQEVRREQMKSFNEDKSESSVKLFLLSTRAGGLGINLVAADTVIFFDSDWNPQMDLQAQDRVHRIGQKKPVLIFRLVSANTVESRLLKRAGDKRKLEALVIQNGMFKLPAGQASDVLRGGKGGSGGNKNESSSDMAKSLLALEGEKVQLAEEDDEIISDETLEKLLDRSPEAYARKTGFIASGANGADAFEVTETNADGANEQLARFLAE